MDATQLHREVLRLQARILKLIALLRVLLVVLKISRFSLNHTRLPDGGEKRSLLRVIDRARSSLPLRSVLRAVRLSPSRYHHWKRENPCVLDDRPSCPRLSPQQLTAAEVEAIHEVATSQEYRHVPTGTLALLAQRLGKVFASPSTWYRLIRGHQWRRPRQRVHPAKPKIGIRASHPNEVWHIDTTVVRLLDASRAYLHAVIDNYSRRILAWKVSARFNPNITAELRKAVRSPELKEQTAGLEAALSPGPKPSRPKPKPNRAANRADTPLLWVRSAFWGNVGLGWWGGGHNLAKCSSSRSRETSG